MNPLTTIPPNIRTALYWVGYVVGVIGQGITIVWAAIAASSPDVAMPLGLMIASAVIGLLQTQLNLLAGSNVPSYYDVVEGQAAPVLPPHDQRGAVDVGTAIVVAILVLLVLIVVVVLR